MEAIPFNEQYEAPIVELYAIEVEGIICGSVDNGGIEGGIPDEI
jgi:hypothetical protein